MGIVLCSGKPGEIGGRGRTLAGVKNVPSALSEVLSASS